MKPPGKTTLGRMMAAAAAEAERIENSQDTWVQSGVLSGYTPQQIEKRDDFAGIVRLIEKIMASPQAMEMLSK